MKKYEITNEQLVIGSTVLHRIKNIATGKLGGWVENESNLSHEGTCWIANDAKVCGNAKVFGNAKVYEKAIVTENAIIHGNARIYGNAWIWGNAHIFENARIYDNARIFGNPCIYENVKVYERAKIYDLATLCGNSLIFGDAQIGGSVMVFGKAMISGHVEFTGNIKIGNNTIISKLGDYIIFTNWWSSGRSFIWTKNNNMYSVGCFDGTGEELIAKAYNDSKISGDNYKAIVDYVNNTVLKSKIN